MKKYKILKYLCLVIGIIALLTGTVVVAKNNAYFNNAIPVSSIKLNKTSVSIGKGQSVTLTVTINPTNATNKTITWTSSNKKIAKVSSNGKVTGVSAGTATITAKTKNGKIATSKVKVSNAITYNIQSSVVTEYLKNTSNMKNIYSKYKCNKTRCDIPNEYSTSLTGNINIYKYDGKNKDFIVKTKVSNLNYYLIPNNTYYLESTSDSNKYEIVKVTGNLRMLKINSIANFRDLGGWKADNGTIKYGMIYRSATTNSLKNLTQLNILNIKRVVDLRPNGEINTSSAVEGIRSRVSVTQYSTDKTVRSAVEKIMKAIVNENRNVLFNCNFGRDRTGTIAYMIEGILGVSLANRRTDFELTYLYSPKRTRNDGSLNNLVNLVNKYNKTNYEQESFINWYLSGSSNKTKDLKLINEFRKKMIDGTPHEYKLVKNKLVVI